jgi:flavodoxin/formate hydrogenlyase subunit 6/NADH:ubiquinone oxidoreductase subunit I
MKCIVIYFSQTGNTEKMAKAIQKGVKKAAGHCDIAKLKDVNPRRLYQYDLIGLGSSVIAWAEPGNVRAFISDMKFVGRKHLFYFATHGTKPEHLFPSIIPKLQKKGLTVIGWRSWFANCTLMFMPSPYPTAGHPDEIDLKEAEEFGREMVERSRKISAGETKLIPPTPPPAAPIPKKEVYDEVDSKFRSMLKFHEELCIYPKCRLCMDNCPMDGIDLSVKPPVLLNPCIKCCFCMFICPTGALDIDDWLEYATPQIRETVPNVFVPALAEAEAEGRFRRIVPIEKIDYSTPLYKKYNKHPRWVIGKGLQTSK